MNKILTLLCMILCLSVQAQPPTDWQLMNLKGKVKEVTYVFSKVDDHIKVKLVVRFREDGYLLNKELLEQKLGGDGLPTLITIDRFTTYKGNKRVVKTYMKDDELASTAEEEWISDTVRTIATKGSEEEKDLHSIVTTTFNKQGQLVTTNMKIGIDKDSGEADFEFESKSAYDSQGYLVESTEKDIKRGGVQKIKVVNKAFDSTGNVIESNYYDAERDVLLKKLIVRYVYYN